MQMLSTAGRAYTIYNNVFLIAGWKSRTTLLGVIIIVQLRLLADTPALQLSRYLPGICQVQLFSNSERADFDSP